MSEFAVGIAPVRYVSASVGEQCVAGPWVRYPSERASTGTRTGTWSPRTSAPARTWPDGRSSFVGLGFEIEGRAVLEGEFLDTVIGIPNARTEIVMLRPPGGGTGLELPSFIRLDHEPGSPDPMHNEPGLRNVTFEVDDLQAILDRLAADGYHLVGSVGQYEGLWHMASARGPEGFIVNLAQPINNS